MTAGIGFLMPCWKRKSQEFKGNGFEDPAVVQRG